MKWLSEGYVKQANGEIPSLVIMVTSFDITVT